MPKIQFKRGLESKLPVLAEGEPGFTTDSQKLYIGSETGNVQFAKSDDLTELQTDLNSQLANKANADEVNAQLAEMPKNPYNNLLLQQGTVNDMPRGLTLKKYGQVLGPGATGAWDDSLIESPVVWFDENRQKYGMVYVGYKKDAQNKPSVGQVGLAWSKDLVNWTKEINPLLSPTGTEGDVDQYGLTAPYMWYEDGIYYLFYDALAGTGYETPPTKLCVATSTDLVNWNRYAGNPIIAPDPVINWIGECIYHVNIVKKDGSYIMFFNAKGSDSIERIGYATSSDLFNWSIPSDNPILEVGASGTWDDNKVGDPSIYKVGNTWYMAYFGYDGSVARDGVAFTTEESFPKGWRKYEDNPILSPGVANTFDHKFAHKPFIFQTPNRHYHYYTAESLWGRVIGLAIDDLYSIQKETVNKRCGESTRNVTATTFSALSDSTVMLDVRRQNLEMRILIRGKVDVGQTLTARDKSLNTTAQVTITSDVWSNYVSQWVSVPYDRSTPYKNTNIEASVTGGLGSIGNIEYEFRWDSI